jgi:HEAT repeat protein
MSSRGALPQHALVGPGAADAGRRSRVRGPAMALPYVGILVGAVVLARIPQSAFERLWWFAPAAAFAYVAAFTLTVVLAARRRRLARNERDAAAALEPQLRNALDLSPADRRRALQRLVPDLHAVRAASGGWPGPERTALRVALTDFDARAAVESELARTRRKWRRADALSTLGWLADERSVPALRDALHGSDPDLAYVAGQSLADYDAAQACGCLVEALRAGCIPRPLAATLLEGSRFGGAPALIADARDDRDPEVRSWVAYLLGRCRDARAGKWLASLAADPEPEVRASAAEALGPCPNATILARLLHDDHPLVRANAAKAVGRAGLAELASELAPLLRDPRWSVRQSAALSLKNLGGAAVHAVRPLLDDVDRFARNKAAEVLIEEGYVSEQITLLGAGERAGAAATLSLTAIARADARSAIEGGAEAADPVTRDRLRDILDHVAESQ